MRSCTLRPPNFDRLSGDAISGFVQQKKSRHDWFVDHASVNTRDGVLPTQSPSQRLGDTEMHSGTRQIWYEKSVETKRTDGENLEQDVANPSEFTKNEATPHEVQATDPLVPQTNITVEAYRRELRRKRQVRYRKKQKDRMLHCESENRKLELEIAGLKARRSACSPALPNSVWSSAAQFFQEFRRGFQGSEESTLKTKMIVDAPSVIFNGERGIEAMRQSLKRIYLWFDRPEFEIEHFVEGPTNSLEATSILSITIAEKTLSHVFPYLCTDKSAKSLGRRLLGQRIAVCLVTRFEWDTTRGRISSMVTKSDLMKPMLNLLGNLEDVCHVFEKATMSLDFQWTCSTIV